MNYRSLFVCGALGATLLAGGALAQAPALPPPPGPPTVTGPSKIAIFNIQEAILTTQDGKKLNAAMQARFAPKKAELANDAKGISALQSQLAAGGNTMSAEAKDALNRQITSKQRDYQQDTDNATSDYQSAQTDLMNTVGNKMMPIVKTYAEQHGYTVVLDVSLGWPQNPVLYYNPGTVITGDIIKLYDQAHPAVAGTPPAGNR